MRPSRACLVLLLPIFASAAKVSEVPQLSSEIGTGQRLNLSGSRTGTPGLTPSLQGSQPTLQGSLLPPSAIPQVSVSVSPVADGVKDQAPPLQTAAPGSPGQLEGTVRQSAELGAGMETPSGPVAEEQVRQAAALFDGAARSLAAPAESAPGYSPRLITAAAQGEGRRDWSIGGKPATYLGGGGFKDIIVHPDDPEVLLTLFTQAGSNDAPGSRSERNLDLGRHRPLEQLGLAPRVLQLGALKVERSRGERQVSYYMQERVRGRALSQGSTADLPLVRVLFDRLVAARIKLTDRVLMLENIMVGTTRSQPVRQAFVVDTGEAVKVADRSLMDRLARRPDPLREYYDALYREIAASLGSPRRRG
ncbi:MAG: hypothetical protein PHU21_10045 [Elusimicrobia bacterium]|nr:hypothetical protein [Elusimicrobiota bacterium]